MTVVVHIEAQLVPYDETPKLPQRLQGTYLNAGAGKALTAPCMDTVCCRLLESFDAITMRHINHPLCIQTSKLRSTSAIRCTLISRAGYAVDKRLPKVTERSARNQLFPRAEPQAVRVHDAQRWGTNAVFKLKRTVCDNSAEDSSELGSSHNWPSSPSLVPASLVSLHPLRLFAEQWVEHDYKTGGSD